MKLNRNDIEKLVEQKYMLMNKHPELDLYILNYSRSAQFEKFWNEYTLMARGLVIDGDFNIIARPFKKFFNVEEHDEKEIPYELPFEVFDKMDGSLGIIFFYENDWHVATRGSFVSDQAIRGKEILNRKFSSGELTLNINYTYLVEIIYPENRIVVDYKGKEDLVLLAVVDTEFGIEFPYRFMECSGFDVVKRYSGVEDVTAIRSLLEDDTHEGVIVRFSNGFRMKVKWKEYVRLHGIVTNVSTKIIWEFLKDGKPLDELLERVPDEFDAWVKNEVRCLKENFYAQEWNAKNVFATINVNTPNKKEFAEQAVKFNCRPILFKMYDGKPYDNIIWKMIEPEFAKPFSNDVDI